MFRNAKKFVATSLAVVMTFGLSTIGWAAEGQDVKVQLNGQEISFDNAKPIYRDDRVYVPFRTVFESLGASVDYDAATNTITATKENTSVQFVIGSKDITVIENGKGNVVQTDAASFQENGVTFVPARFAAQAFGYEVEWNDDTQTSSIIAPGANVNTVIDNVAKNLIASDELNTMLTDVKGKFTIMDKYMEYARTYSENAYKFSGTINFSMSVAELAAPITAKGTISGISESDKANMNVALKLDTAVLEKLLGTSELTGDDATEAKQLLAALGDIKMDFIVDMNTGKYYIHAPLISTLTGSSEDAWYLVDLDEMFGQLTSNSDFSFKSLMDMSKKASFEEFLNEMVKMLPQDSEENINALKAMVQMYKEMFSDDAFEKVSDGYVSNYSMTEGTSTVNLTFKLTEKDNKVTGYSLDMSAKDSGTEILTMKASQTDNNANVNMKMNVPDLLNMDFDITMDLDETTEKALSEPKSGSNIISVNDLMQ